VVERALDAGFELHAGEDVAVLADELGLELVAYFEPTP
jgi:hypothetical protein